MPAANEPIRRPPRGRDTVTRLTLLAGIILGAGAALWLLARASAR